MTPIDQIRIGTTQTAGPGGLFIRRPGAKNAIRLIGTRVDEDGDQDSIKVCLGEPGSQRFLVQPTATNEGLWLQAMRWELRVDPDSAYTLSSGVMAVGHAFVMRELRGLICIHAGMEQFLTKEGNLLPLSSNFEGYVGFKRWQIVHWPEEDGAAEILIDYDPDATQEVSS